MVLANPELLSSLLSAYILFILADSSLIDFILLFLFFYFSSAKFADL